jgi:uncharacterized protein YllA (UPF0747 family)
LIINNENIQTANKLGYKIHDFFQTRDQLINSLVIRESDLQLSLEKEKKQLHEFYDNVIKLTTMIDVTLAHHTTALRKQAVEKIEALEKKMLRAEKRKFEAQQRQVTKLKQQLFPNNALQERVENFSTFYCMYGRQLIQQLYNCSLTLEQQFAIVNLVDQPIS